jgi:hypothetical protein
LYPRHIKWSRIKPHDLRVTENAQQRRNIVRCHPAQVEAWGFDDYVFHHRRNATGLRFGHVGPANLPLQFVYSEAWSATMDHPMAVRADYRQVL